MVDAGSTIYPAHLMTRLSQKCFWRLMKMLLQRLQVETSACLKIYASLNDKVYERFERMLFCLLGIRVLAPIKEVQKLKQDSTKKTCSQKKDANNKGYLTNICVRMKHILKLWYGVMRTMKSAEYQTSADCKKFEENTIELNRALHLLIDDPPIPGRGLKYSN